MTGCKACAKRRAKLEALAERFAGMSPLEQPPACRACLKKALAAERAARPKRVRPSAGPRPCKDCPTMLPAGHNRAVCKPCHNTRQRERRAAATPRQRRVLAGLPPDPPPPITSHQYQQPTMPRHEYLEQRQQQADLDHATICRITDDARPVWGAR